MLHHLRRTFEIGVTVSVDEEICDPYTRCWLGHPSSFAASFAK